MHLSHCYIADVVSIANWVSLKNGKQLSPTQFLIYCYILQIFGNSYSGNLIACIVIIPHLNYVYHNFSCHYGISL